MKRRLRRILDAIAFRAGYRRMQNNGAVHAINVYEKGNLLDSFYSTLLSINFDPKHIIDVGANHGTWTRHALKYFPNCQYTLLEPQAYMKGSVSDLLAENPNIRFYAMGAGNKAGSFNFSITERDDSCNFRYSPEEAKEKNLEHYPVNVVTLNELVAENGLPVPGIIKIDAEGLDLEVLEGAGNFFGKTEVFLAEAGVVNKIFKNSFLSLINFMDERGYRLFDITDINRPFSPQVLWLVELVFVKKGGIIDNHHWI
jgi:FkbM family methyltransferase